MLKSIRELEENLNKLITEKSNSIIALKHMYSECDGNLTFVMTINDRLVSTVIFNEDKSRNNQFIPERSGITFQNTNIHAFCEDVLHCVENMLDDGGLDEYLGVIRVNMHPLISEVNKEF